MHLSKWMAKELAGNEDVDDFSVVENKLVDSTRWSKVYSLVVKNTLGEYYQTFYERGATEQQDTYPFDDCDEDVEFVKVYPVETVVTTYETKIPL